MIKKSFANYLLQNQIQKHNETESELLKENNNLKEKLLKEREEFLAELNRESSSKQEMLDKLKAKMKEQEEVRLKEKEALEQMLKNEVEQIRLAKEKVFVFLFYKNIFRTSCFPQFCQCIIWLYHKPPFHP